LTRSKGRFHHANAFDTHNSGLAMLSSERIAESLDPSVFTARNHGGGSFVGLPRG
jgi:hypothetical protein